MKPLIEMKNISKIYDNGVVANDHVNFSVNKGEIHALVGENGAGKSTLMKILYGIEKPTEGQIIIDGKEVSLIHHMMPLLPKLAWCTRTLCLVPSFTVAQNVVLGNEPVKNGLIDKDEVLKNYQGIIRTIWSICLSRMQLLTASMLVCGSALRF